MVTEPEENLTNWNHIEKPALLFNTEALLSHQVSVWGLLFYEDELFYKSYFKSFMHTPAFSHTP